MKKKMNKFIINKKKRGRSYTMTRSRNSLFSFLILLNINWFVSLLRCLWHYLAIIPIQTTMTTRSSIILIIIGLVLIDIRVRLLQLCNHCRNIIEIARVQNGIQLALGEEKRTTSQKAVHFTKLFVFHFNSVMVDLRCKNLEISFVKYFIMLTCDSFISNILQLITFELVGYSSWEQWRRVLFKKRQLTAWPSGIVITWYFLYSDISFICYWSNIWKH